MRLPFRTDKKWEPSRPYCRLENIVVPPAVVWWRLAKQILLMVVLITSLQVFCLSLGSPVHAQSTATLEGEVNDQHGAILPTVEITVVSRPFDVRRVSHIDADGRYQIAAPRKLFLLFS